MIQSDRFFNKLTLTNDNIPDDKLLANAPVHLLIFQNIPGM